MTTAAPATTKTPTAPATTTSPTASFAATATTTTSATSSATAPTTRSALGLDLGGDVWIVDAIGERHLDNVQLQVHHICGILSCGEEEIRQVRQGMRLADDLCRRMSQEGSAR